MESLKLKSIEYQHDQKNVIKISTEPFDNSRYLVCGLTRDGLQSKNCVWGGIFNRPGNLAVESEAFISDCPCDRAVSFVRRRLGVGELKIPNGAVAVGIFEMKRDGDGYLDGLDRIGIVHATGNEQ